jgi:hypothetical protein
MGWVSLCQWEASITDLLKTYVFLLYFAFPSLTTVIDSLLFKALGHLSAPSPQFGGPIYRPGCCRSMESQTTHSKVHSNPTRGWNGLEGGCTSFHLLPFYTSSPHICFPPALQLHSIFAAPTTSKNGIGTLLSPLITLVNVRRPSESPTPTFFWPPLVSFAVRSTLGWSGSRSAAL